MRVLIVGAGPTGLTAAIELARQGVAPVIIDKRADASTLSRAVGITPRSLKALSASGVSQRLISEGVPMDGLRVYFGVNLALEMPLRSERAFFPTLLCLPQDRTETIMAECLGDLGVSVRYGTELTTISSKPSEVVAGFRDGSEERYDYVIGADGARSTVREQAGISAPGKELPGLWSIADVDLADWPHPGKLTVVQAGPGVVAVAVPLTSTRYRLVASHDNALEAMPLPLNAVQVRRKATFTVAVRRAETFSLGRVHLAGDAAHCHSPVGGRGMNLGIADAVALARCILDEQFDGYSADRHLSAAEAARVTERSRRMAIGVNFARRMAFRGLVTAARSSRTIRERLGSFIVDF